MISPCKCGLIYHRSCLEDWFKAGSARCDFCNFDFPLKRKRGSFGNWLGLQGFEHLKSLVGCVLLGIFLALLAPLAIALFVFVYFELLSPVPWNHSMLIICVVCAFVFLAYFMLMSFICAYVHHVWVIWADRNQRICLVQDTYVQPDPIKVDMEGVEAAAYPASKKEEQDEDERIMERRMMEDEDEDTYIQPDPIKVDMEGVEAAAYPASKKEEQDEDERIMERRMREDEDE
jgi:hypothetical protein